LVYSCFVIITDCYLGPFDHRRQTWRMGGHDRQIFEWMGRWVFMKYYFILYCTGI